VVLTLPAGPGPSSSLFKVGGDIEVLLFASNLRLHSSSGLAPFFHHFFGFFFTTFVSELLVLGFEPEFLQLLLEGLTSGIVILIVRAPFEPILSVVSRRLI